MSVDQGTYLRVELCAVVASSAVQSDDFVADDVVASLQVSGDSGGRGEVRLDQVVGDPGSRAAGSDQTTLRDLTPSKRAGGERRAVA